MPRKQKDDEISLYYLRRVMTLSYFREEHSEYEFLTFLDALYKKLRKPKNWVGDRMTIHRLILDYMKRGYLAKSATRSAKRGHPDKIVNLYRTTREGIQTYNEYQTAPLLDIIKKERSAPKT